MATAEGFEIASAAGSFKVERADTKVARCNPLQKLANPFHCLLLHLRQKHIIPPLPLRPQLTRL
jgi:hypothetical protein